jgi:hypothetical protein
MHKVAGTLRLQQAGVSCRASRGTRSMFIGTPLCNHHECNQHFTCTCVSVPCTWLPPALAISTSTPSGAYGDRRRVTRGTLGQRAPSTVAPWHFP